MNWRSDRVRNPGCVVAAGVSLAIAVIIWGELADQFASRVLSALNDALVGVGVDIDWWSLFLVVLIIFFVLAAIGAFITRNDDIDGSTQVDSNDNESP